MQSRRTVWLTIAFGVAAAILAAGVDAGSAGAAEPPMAAAQVDRGRDLAARLCAGCHLNPGQGEKSAASSIPGFTAVANRPGQTFAGIVDWLRSVPPMMPNHRLSQDEMSDIASYILSLAVEPLDTGDNVRVRP